MRGLQLTSRAFREFYSAPALCLIGEKFRRDIQDLDIPCVRLLVLRSDGLICLPEETPSVEEKNFFSPIGVGSGLLGLLVSKGESKAASLWHDFACQQGSQARLATVSASFSNARRQANIYRTVLGLVSSRFGEMQSQLNTREHQLVELRHANERHNVNLSLAKRMLDVFAAPPLTMVLELPESGGSWQAGGEPLRSFRLPCDGVGFAGLSLFFDLPQGQRAEGSFYLCVRRAVDGAVYIRQEISYAAIAQGWRLFQVDDDINLVAGDLILDLAWLDDGEGVTGRPQLALCEDYVERFGAVDEAGHPIAMRIYKGFSAPRYENADFGLGLSNNNSVGEAPLSLRKLEKAASFLHGPKAEQKLSSQLGEKIVVWQQAEGWLQTHLAEGTLSGVWLNKALPVHAGAVKVQIENAHEDCSPCLFLMIVVKEAAKPEIKQLQHLVKKIIKGDVPLAGQHESGFLWSGMVAVGGAKMDLHLALPEALDSAADIGLIATSLSGKAAFGWCRWLDFRVEYASFPEGPVPNLPQKKSLVAFRHFSEMANQFQALGEPGKLATFEEKYGFPAIRLDEDMAALQTHPVQDNDAAAYFHNTVFSGTMLIDFEYGAAHNQSPACLFMAALIRKNDSATSKAFVDALSSFDPTSPDGWSGKAADGAIEWVAGVASGGARGTLTLRLDEPLTGTAGLAFAARSLTGGFNYAWCRWYSMKFHLVMPPELQTAG